MSVFTKVLRAGEGKKVRRLAELVPLIGDLEPNADAFPVPLSTTAMTLFRQPRNRRLFAGSKAMLEGAAQGATAQRSFT